MKKINYIGEILEKIKSGELSRENDETGAGGFWDLAYELTGIDGTIDDDEQDMVERIYNTFWEIAEGLLEDK